MKTILSIILAGLLGVVGLVAQNAASGSVAGKWTLSAESPHGPLAGTLEVKQDGSKITGTCTLEMLGSLEFSGNVDGKKISFAVEVEPGHKFTFNGTVEGGKMSGKTDPLDGNWSATKQ